MIPAWQSNGDLPEGIHFSTWSEIQIRLGFNARRQRLLAGLRLGCLALKNAGCRLIYLDGSFVSRKAYPEDFDACWDVKFVNGDHLDPIFFDFSQGRLAQKHRFLGEFFPADLPSGPTGKTFVSFFQVNKSTGEPKGLVAVRLAKGQA